MIHQSHVKGIFDQGCFVAGRLLDSAASVRPEVNAGADAVQIYSRFAETGGLHHHIKVLDWEEDVFLWRTRVRRSP